VRETYWEHHLAPQGSHDENAYIVEDGKLEAVENNLTYIRKRPNKGHESQIDWARRAIHMHEFDCAMIVGLCTQEDMMKHDNANGVAPPDLVCPAHYLLRATLGRTRFPKALTLSLDKATKRWRGSTGVQSEAGALIWMRS